MNALFLLLGAILGKNMADISKDKVNKRDKSEEIYIYLYKLYPVVGIITISTILIFTEIVITIELPNISILGWCLVATIYYWMISMYGSNMRHLYGKNKEIKQYYFFSIVLMTGTVMLIFAQNYDIVANIKEKICYIAYTIISIYVLKFMHILHCYCKLTDK